VETWPEMGRMDWCTLVCTKEKLTIMFQTGIVSRMISYLGRCGCQRVTRGPQAAQKVVQRKNTVHDHKTLTVLVEEEEMIRRVWSAYFQASQMPIAVFDSPESFTAVLNDLKASDKPVQFYFDQAFGERRSEGLRMAAMVRDWPNRRFSALVTNYGAWCFSDALRQAEIDDVFDKYPEKLFGQKFKFSDWYWASKRLERYGKVPRPRMRERVQHNGNELAVLIEDNCDIVRAWELCFRRKQMPLLAFSSAAAFKKAVPELVNSGRPIQFYLDYNLEGQDETGTDLAVMVRDWPNRIATTIVSGENPRRFIADIMLGHVDRVCDKYLTEIFGNKENGVMPIHDVLASASCGGAVSN
jgi:hypothetical protein